MPIENIPTNANLLPWLVGAIVTMFGGMCLWIRTSVDAKLNQILEEDQHARDDRADMTAAILVLSIAIRNPEIDIHEMAEGVFNKLKEKKKK